MPLLSIISDVLRAEFDSFNRNTELIRRNLGGNQSRIICEQFGRLSENRTEKQYSPTFRIFAVVSSSFIAKSRALQREKKQIIKMRYSTLNGATIDALQKLNYDRMQETHVLGTAYRKTIHAEMTDHFWYILERFAKLSQDVCV